MQTKESFRLRFSNQEELTSFAAHSELELLYLLEGTVDIQVEQKHTHMNKDDILLINPDRRRSVSYAEKPLMMHLLIDYAMVKNACQEQDVLFWCDSTGEDREKYDELRALLKKLILHHVQLENYEDSFAFLSDCYGILQLLTFQFMVKAADVQWNEEGDRFEERLFKINNYINTNYDQAISIKDLSEKLFLSIGYLSRFFKKNYGMNFASYLTNVRLVHAADELLYTNISVTRVAYDCGFTSAAIFNKAFKKVYDVTPTECRKRAEKSDRIQDTGSDQKELAGQIEQIVLENVLDMEDDKASSKIKTAENSYSVLEQTPLRNYWGELINIGEAVNILDSSIREHLMNLQWDGVPRIRSALHHFLGAEESDYNENCLRLFMMGAVKRVFAPGSKYELMLVLTGGQGAGKSTFLRFLAIRDEWFSDDLKRLDDEKIYQRLAGHWILEMSEMVATANAKSIEDIKSFLSRNKDTYKFPYDRYAMDHLRQCVFAGTTNRTDFLPMDRSGNRRFLPVQVNSGRAETHILTDEAASRSYINQMWAEIMKDFQVGQECTHLSKEMEQQLFREQETFQQEDTLAGQIYSFMDNFRGDKLCSKQIYHEGLNHPYDEPKQWETREICEIVNTGISKGVIRGWQAFVSSRRFEKYGTQRGWERIQPPEKEALAKPPSLIEQMGFTLVEPEDGLPF